MKEFHDNCLFPNPLIHEQTSFMLAFEKHAPALQKLIHDDDERSYIIVAALNVEEAIDLLLKAWIGNNHYKVLVGDNRQGISFNIKVNLLRSFYLIPETYLECASLIRRLRNEFVHNIDCDRIEQLDERLLNELREREQSGFIKLEHTRAAEDLIPFERLISLVSATIRALSSYEATLRFYHQKIRDQDFIHKLRLHESGQF